MAEEMQGPESEGLGGGANAAATGIALGRASSAVDDEVIAFLRDQRHHMAEQLKQLHLDIWEKWLGVFLRLATAAVGVAAAGAVGFLVWDAAHSNGLRIEPFSVPPDLATRGLTGEVVASRVIDRLNLLQSQTFTGRPALSYSHSWGEHGITLEIPETGISLAEADGWLREKLGHDTRVTGEIVHGPAGLTITSRAGDEGVETVAGSDADIDRLVERAAESVYRLTQPYRYAIFLMRHERRYGDALPIFRDLTLNGSPEDRRWSYTMWAQTALLRSGDTEVGLAMYRQARDADPDALNVYINLAGAFFALGRWEEALATDREWRAHLLGGRQQAELVANIPFAEKRILADTDFLTGAYADALPVHARNLRSGVTGTPLLALRLAVVRDLIGVHDLAAARAIVASTAWPTEQAGNGLLLSSNTELLFAASIEDWTKALGLADAREAYLKVRPQDRRAGLVHFAPALAYTQARLGRFADAERTIAPTPGNCYPCLIVRAQVAALKGEAARTDWWFERAAEAGPSFPFAFHEWGKALLARGKPDAAIEKFAIANRKTPHFADALEGWGEALMAQKRPDQALEKFRRSGKICPRLGSAASEMGRGVARRGQPG